MAHAVVRGLHPVEAPPAGAALAAAFQADPHCALYERHGFEVTEELSLPRGGPPIWLMWREPA